MYRTGFYKKYNITVMPTFMCRDRDRPVTIPSPSRPRSVERRPP
jgi:hypothetical protein